MAHLPGHGWRDLKQELMSKWHELTESDLEKTRGERLSLAELLEKKVGLKIEEASEHIEKMAERFHLYDEPKESKADIISEKKEKVLELTPENPYEVASENASARDTKLKDHFNNP